MSEGGRAPDPHRRIRGGRPSSRDADTGYGNALNVHRDGPRLRADRRRRAPPRGPGLPEALRPPRRQGGGAAATRWSQKLARRAATPPPIGSRADRAHRRARRRGPGGGASTARTPTRRRAPTWSSSRRRVDPRPDRGDRPRASALSEAHQHVPAAARPRSSRLARLQASWAIASSSSRPTCSGRRSTRWKRRWPPSDGTGTARSLADRMATFKDREEIVGTRAYLDRDRRYTTESPPTRPTPPPG